jgi:DNA-binding transcriptional MerR regulator
MSEPAQSTTRRGPARQRGEAYLRIGEVIDRLVPDFPDTTISKVRFLESEGLLEPSRTPKGYRLFSAADVERLRYILSAQRDHYLPLRVIREHLDALDRGLQPEAPLGRPRPPRGAGSDAPTDPEAFGAAGEARFTRQEVLEESGLTPSMFDTLQDHGLLRADSDGFFDADALAVADAASALAGFGLDARHLRGFKTAADREAGLVEQVVAPVARLRDPDARQRAAETAREMAAQSVRLHTALVRQALPRELRR